MGRNQICQIQDLAEGSGFSLAHSSSSSLLGLFKESLFHLPPQLGVFFQLYHVTSPVDLAHTVAEGGFCQYRDRKQWPGL